MKKVVPPPLVVVEKVGVNPCPGISNVLLNISRPELLNKGGYYSSAEAGGLGRLDPRKTRRVSYSYPLRVDLARGGSGFNWLTGLRTGRVGSKWAGGGGLGGGLARG